MPADLDLALRVRADMQEALQGIGALNRSLGDTAKRGDAAGAALTRTSPQKWPDFQA